MNVTQALNDLDDLLDDDGSDGNKNWPLAERVRYLHRAEKGMIRKMAERNTKYANSKFVILGTAATTDNTNRYRYELPFHVDNITAVRELASVTEQRKRPLAPQRLDDPTVGYTLEDSNSLVLSHNTALDIEVDAVKMPAPPYRGTIVQAFGSAGGVYLEVSISSTTSEFEVSHVPGAYVNTRFEVSGTDAADGSRLVKGQVRKCAASSIVAASSLARIGLTLEKNLDTALLASDTIESIFQVQEKHARLLILRAARQCFQAKHNVDGLSAINNELAFEEHEFSASISPRVKQEPAKVRTSTTTRRFSQDIDTDSTFSYN